MRDWRSSLVATGDAVDDAPPRVPPMSGEASSRRKRRKVLLSEEEEEDEDGKGGIEKATHCVAGTYAVKGRPLPADAKPIGDVVRVSGKGKSRRNHYLAFLFDAVRYDLDDPVLCASEEPSEKPYVAIIKDITQGNDNRVMVTGQWFYRPEDIYKKMKYHLPEDAEKIQQNRQSCDTRELFYSFHCDEVPAESVMHKCVVHFIPRNKRLPSRKQHPGFIVRKVYDAEQRKLLELTDNCFTYSEQNDLDGLAQRTLSRLGDLANSKTKDPPGVSRADVVPIMSCQTSEEGKMESISSNASEYYNILSKFKALAHDPQRDKWLQRLLQGVRFICCTIDNRKSENREIFRGDGTDHAHDRSSTGENKSHKKKFSESSTFIWPDAAVPAVTALEKTSHDALSSDIQKYNQKMRQLLFNLKNNILLARRLLNGELEPSKILTMSPTELKGQLHNESPNFDSQNILAGLTADEMGKKDLQ